MIYKESHEIEKWLLKISLNHKKPIAMESFISKTESQQPSILIK